MVRPIAILLLEADNMTPMQSLVLFAVYSQLSQTTFAFLDDLTLSTQPLTEYLENISAAEISIPKPGANDSLTVVAGLSTRELAARDMQCPATSARTHLAHIPEKRGDL